MKKLALLCAAAASGLLAINASASTTSDYSVLSISVTVSTNTTEVEKGSTDSYVIKSHTYTTGDLLQLFESPDFADTKFPAGARIAVGWDWDSEVLVIDGKGNILYNASEDGYPDAYFTIDFTSTYGPESYNYVSAEPGHDDWSYLTTGSFTLYDDNSMYIDLFGSGPGTWSVNQNWNAHDNYSTYSHSESLNASGTGSSESFNGYNDASVNMKITAKGSGSGETDLY